VFWVVAAGIVLGAVIALDDQAHPDIHPPIAPLAPVNYGERQ
jgi:hypothetical protein